MHFPTLPSKSGAPSAAHSACDCFQSLAWQALKPGLSQQRPGITLAPRARRGAATKPITLPPRTPKDITFSVLELRRRHPVGMRRRSELGYERIWFLRTLLVD